MEELKEYEKREITELLKNDLYYNENEENEAELETLQAENQELKDEQKHIEAELENISNSNELLDKDFLFEFLENRGLLTDELKNTINLYAKLYQKGVDLFNYVTPMQEWSE